MILAGRVPPAVAVWVALGVGVVATYWGAISLPFQYDDFHSIVENPHIRTWRNIPAYFSRPDMFSEDPRSAMYRPFVLASFAIDYQLHESDGGAYHWTNLLLHVVNTGLVAFLAYFLTRRLAGAGVAGVIFGLHPVNAETVLYVSSRSESMCALFFLIAFLAYLQAGSKPRWRPLWMTASLTAFAAALLSKAVGVTLPLVLALYELRISSRAGLTTSCIRRLCRRQWPYWIIGLVYVSMTRQMLQEAVVGTPVRGMGIQLWTQTKALAYYLKLIVIPHPLTVEHQFNLGHGLTQGAAAWSALFLVSLGTVLVLAWRSGRRSGPFWMMWSFVILLPTLVVPLNVLVNEHRLYLPSVALAAVAALFVAHSGAQRARVAVAFVLLSGAAFAGYDTARVHVWEDSERLWSDAVGKGPAMPRPYIYLGDRLHAAGSHDRALQSYRTALRVNPAMLSGLDRVVTYNNIGATLLTMGRSQEAIQAYQTALTLDSTYVKAREALEGLVAFQPKAEDAVALRQQGLLALWKGQVELAIACLRGALQKQRSPETLMALGLAYERQRDAAAAIRTYRELAADFTATGYAAGAARRADSLSALANGG